MRETGAEKGFAMGFSTGRGELILSGGAPGPDIVPCLVPLADRCRSEWKPLLFVPHAWPESRFAECEEKMRPCFESAGLPRECFRMASTLEEHTEESLAAFAAVFLGGGNTFELLHLLRESGFDRPLLEFLRGGGWVGGNSAGAIVCGRDIRYAHDPNTVGMTDFRGFDLVGGRAVWCHYAPDPHDDEIEDFFRRTRIPVLALPDRGGVWVRRDESRILGDERAWIFGRSAKESLLPGESLKA